MNFVDFAFFAYMFTGLYMTSLFIILYFNNRREIFSYPASRFEPVSIVVPCYNAEKRIGGVIDSLLGLDYPKEMIEIIVVDDKSTDGSARVIEGYTKKYENVRLIVNSRNSGKAAEPTNLGIKAAKYDYVAVADDDSTPDRDALKKMIGFLQREERVAAVTCAVLVKNPRNFMQKLQDIEYTVIAWTRKLLDCVDAVYVTPGPFALYRKNRLVEVGMFDVNNMTQDIEIVWRLLSRGYIARMCLATRVHSESPASLGKWFRQRVRWDIGGIQTLLKYKNMLFRKGMLGNFVIPLFTISFFMGLFGLGLFAYLFIKRALLTYLFSSYAIGGDATLFALQDLSFTPSILNFLGVALFLLGFFFTMAGLMVMKSKPIKTNIFNLFFYLVVYLSLYPIVLIYSIGKMVRGNYKW